MGQYRLGQVDIQRRAPRVPAEVEPDRGLLAVEVEQVAGAGSGDVGEMQVARIVLFGCGEYGGAIHRDFVAEAPESEIGPIADFAVTNATTSMSPSPEKSARNIRCSTSLHNRIGPCSSSRALGTVSAAV